MLLHSLIFIKNTRCYILRLQSSSTLKSKNKDSFIQLSTVLSHHVHFISDKTRIAVFAMDNSFHVHHFEMKVETF